MLRLRCLHTWSPWSRRARGSGPLAGADAPLCTHHTDDALATSGSCWDSHSWELGPCSALLPFQTCCLASSTRYLSHCGGRPCGAGRCSRAECCPLTVRRELSSNPLTPPPPPFFLDTKNIPDALFQQAIQITIINSYSGVKERLEFLAGPP